MNGTVKSLIEKLKQFPEDAIVYIQDYHAETGEVKFIISEVEFDEKIKGVVIA